MGPTTRHPLSSQAGRRKSLALRAACLAVALLLGGCSTTVATQVSEQVERLFPSIVRATPTPFQPIFPTLTPTTAPSPTPEPVRELVAWISPGLPPALREQVRLPAGVKTSPSFEASNLQIGPIQGDLPDQVTWLYVLAAPFPTLEEDTSLAEIQRAWRGEPGERFTGSLIMAPETRTAFEARWGPPGVARLETMPAGELAGYAWESRTDWAILPFEDLEPTWKALRVDGLSLFERDTGLDAYPLSVWFGISGQPGALQLLAEKTGAGGSLLPSSNYDPQKMTTLVMSGVTALARATAYKMDTLGITYPGQDVRDWFLNADLAHISNEVSFNEDCPPGSFTSTSTMFCSRVEYIELLDYLGVDIVELTGNHNNDYGRAAFSASLDLYRERGWETFGGGANLEEARTPALVEHNGNRLAFIGCNPVGPPGVWATAELPGAAPCNNYEWMLAEIARLRADGYLPVVTFQYFELYIFNPSDHQARNFKAAVDAGAVIVSGSQAHFPQNMEFYNGGFIHYGLGNLFFDQMDVPVPGTRREFVDRHIFHAGRHIQTGLLTALLEDYARPRPMAEDERRDMLSDIFQSAGW